MTTGKTKSERPYPAGAELVEQGECPRGMRMAIACMWCWFGHMLECHYPNDCRNAECEHFKMEQRAERINFDEKEEDTEP